MKRNTQAATTKNTTTHKTFEYKLRPNAIFITACEAELEHSRQIYNAALQERIECYRMTGLSLGFVEQSRHLTDARSLPDMKAHLRTIQSDALERVDEAFKAFFKRCAKGTGKAGFPRFKGRDRYRTFSQKYEPQRACPLKGDKLTVPGVGTCRVRLSRPIEGRCVQLRITRRASGWYVLLVCEIPKPEPLPATGQSVGVDVGIKSFATLSTGEAIENPRHLNNASANLKKLQRRLSRKKRGSSNRAKARQKVARAHETVTNARKDFHHKAAKSLIDRFDSIAIEDLNVRGMVKNPSLARVISDVAWSAFFTILISKAVNAGRQIEKVNPRYTSMTCSHCGHVQKMPLAVRVFTCEACEFVLDRDHNAAINIQVRLSKPESKPVECDGARRSRNACGSGRNERRPSGAQQVAATRARS